MDVSENGFVQRIVLARDKVEHHHQVDRRTRQACANLVEEGVDHHGGQWLVTLPRALPTTPIQAPVGARPDVGTFHGHAAHGRLHVRRLADAAGWPNLSIAIKVARSCPLDDAVPFDGVGVETRMRQEPGTAGTRCRTAAIRRRRSASIPRLRRKKPAPADIRDGTSRAAPPYGQERAGCAPCSASAGSWISARRRPPAPRLAVEVDRPACREHDHLRLLYVGVKRVRQRHGQYQAPVRPASRGVGSPQVHALVDLRARERPSSLACTAHRRLFCDRVDRGEPAFWRSGLGRCPGCMRRQTRRGRAWSCQRSRCSLRWSAAPWSSAGVAPALPPSTSPPVETLWPSGRRLECGGRRACASNRRGPCSSQPGGTRCGG